MDFSGDDYDLPEEEAMEDVQTDPLEMAIRWMSNTDRSWIDRAACKGEPTDLFFLDKEDQASNILKLKAIKPLCGGCPVKKECLTYAVDNHITYGIWGGYTGTQRRRFKRVRRQQAAGGAVDGSDRPEE